MSHDSTLRSVLLAILLATLTVLGMRIPALVYLGPVVAVAFAGLLFVWAFVFGATHPTLWWLWGSLFSLAPLVYALAAMSLAGPGNLWPIDLFMALVLGLPPAWLGVFVGRLVARRRRKERR